MLSAFVVNTAGGGAGVRGESLLAGPDMRAFIVRLLLVFEVNAIISGKFRSDSVV